MNIKLAKGKLFSETLREKIRGNNGRSLLKCDLRCEAAYLLV